MLPSSRLAPTVTLIVLALAACERSRTPVPVETTRVAPRESVVVAPPPPVPPPAWDAAAGALFLVHGSTPAAASVVFPEYADSTIPDRGRFDVARARGDTVDLLSRAGTIGRARVTAVSGATWNADSCIAWPEAVVQPLTGGVPPAGWTAAFLAGRVQGVRLDSIEGLAPNDSARLAADLTRLVSALPGDTATAFRGVPFAVRVAYRFVPAPGVVVVVADIVRKLNQEANPLEQHTLIVAERDSASAAGAWRAAYVDRSAGSEEAVETSDVLAAIRTSGHPAILLAREGLETTAYALLERSSDGRWRVRWTSLHTGC